MSQTEISIVLDHPMTAKEIAAVTRLPLGTAKCTLVRMRKNKGVAIAGKIGKELIYVRPG